MGSIGPFFSNARTAQEAQVEIAALVKPASTAEKIIQHTKGLLLTPDKWCKMASCHIFKDKIVRRCLSRALHDAFMAQGYPTIEVQQAYQETKQAVERSLPEHHFDIIHFNDDRQTRHSDVICVLDQAAVTIRQGQARRQFDRDCQVE
jgi:hypothetical protein